MMFSANPSHSMTFSFDLLHTDGAARRGRLHTAHGAVETPAFMAVGTQASVKGLTPAQLDEAGVQVVLGNTYHLALRPGDELIAAMGGLHRFMGWQRPILTDSGGYQVYSLAANLKIDDQAAVFRSHIDGSLLELSPERAVRIQENLGSDIAMCLDECPPADASAEKHRDAVRRGIDMFDCVLPTRNGRNAFAFTGNGPLRLRNTCHKRDQAPLESGCACPTCRQFSRAYIHHLFLAEEMLGPILLSLHNLAYYNRLLAEARAAIA